MQTNTTDLIKISFFGPFVVDTVTGERVRNLYPSIGHWFESRKFLPSYQDLHDLTLLCPTLKEARKFTHANQRYCRTDWGLVKHSVLILGLALLQLDRPEFHISGASAAELAEQLIVLQLPPRFIETCVERFLSWSSGPSVGVIGSDIAPASVVGKRMKKMEQERQRWTLISLCNRRAGWLVHDWALSQYVPVQYIGTRKERTSSALLECFLKSCDQVVVFEARGDKRHEAAIKMTRKMNKLCAVELYRAENFATDELQG